jgi:hypothetical protein
MLGTDGVGIAETGGT